MKKLILMLGLAIGASSAVFAQGSLIIQCQSTLGGISTNDPSTSTSAWWASAPLTLEIFAYSGSLSGSSISAINAAWATPVDALGMLNSDGFVQQTIDGNMTLNAPITGAGIFSTGTHTIGNALTITTGNTYTYALFATGAQTVAGEYEGVLCFSPSLSGDPALTPVNFANIWPNQNLSMVFVPVPEPATMALAGLGGLGLLLFRRRK